MSDYSGLFTQASKIVRDALGPDLGEEKAAVPALRTSDDIAGRIDHTLLKADATATAVATLCREADRHDFASVCVNTRWVPTAAEQLADCKVMVCTVVGFPLGAMTRRAKAEEARIAVADGADEVDMVIDLGGLLSGYYPDVYEDILGVVTAARPAPVKVILETGLLDNEQKAVACMLALRAGAAYVKTSTGFNGGGATTADIALMRTMVGDKLGVKASGGIRNLHDAKTMLEAGADRIGASASVTIVAGRDTGTNGY